MRAIAVMCCCVLGMSSAWADDDDDHTAERAAARRDADHLMAVAMAKQTDLAAFATCGQAYVDIYNRNPEANDNDELLFDAATCFEHAKMLGPAIMMNNLLAKYYPQSKLRSASVLAAGKLFVGVAFFDRAAERFEEYAKKFPTESGAKDALVDAITYREALGDATQQIDDTVYFERTYGRSEPRRTAALRYAELTAHEHDVDGQIALLRSYLARFGSVLDDEQAIVATARLGDLLWKRACPVAQQGGLCVKLVRDPPARRGCGPEGLLRVVAQPRPAKREALDAYRDAIARFEHAPAAQTRTARHAAAMAKVALADDELEHLLEATPPRDIDPTRTAKLFSAWLDDQVKVGQRASRQYEAVLQLKDPEASLAAAARLGQITQSLWRALVTIEVPAVVRTGPHAAEKATAYCDALHGSADPLAARAIESFHVCTMKAIELGVGGAWAELCWREGGVMAPAEFPPALELHGVEAPLPFAPSIEPPVTTF